MLKLHVCTVDHIHTNDLQFQGSGHGDLRICVSRDEGSAGTDCTEVKRLDEAALKISSPCATYSYHCPPVYLTITITHTLTRCTGKHVQSTTNKSMRSVMSAFLSTLSIYNSTVPFLLPVSKMLYTSLSSRHIICLERLLEAGVAQPV
jgi:hypothetical protein